jgi:hypothetical protein
MKPSDRLLSQIPCLNDADAYFCFVRSWWDDAGIDAAIWWNHEAEYFLRIVKTGETITPKLPFFDETISISAAEFNQMQDDVLKTEFLTFKSQEEWIAFTHHDYWYGLKTNNPDIEYWIYSKGSIHADTRVMDLRCMIQDRVPQLHYDVEEQ